MYGSKNNKQDRLEQLTMLLNQSAQGLTQADLAQAVGVEWTTIHKDLVALEDEGILLAEDDTGRLYGPARWE